MGAINAILVSPQPRPLVDVKPALVPYVFYYFLPPPQFPMSEVSGQVVNQLLRLVIGAFKSRRKLIIVSHSVILKTTLILLLSEQKFLLVEIYPRPVEIRLALPPSFRLLVVAQAHLFDPVHLARDSIRV
jgi:hypothetical protein